MLVMQTAAKAIKPVKGSVPIQRQLLAEKIVTESWSAGEFVIQESLAQVRYPIYLYFVLLYHLKEANSRGSHLLFRFCGKLCIFLRNSHYGGLCEDSGVANRQRKHFMSNFSVI